jgi:hypothetical protein
MTRYPNFIAPEVSDYGAHESNSRLPLALVLIVLCVGVWLLSEIVRFA